MKTMQLNKCAFCKHWYDPTNTAIKPINAKLWEYNAAAKALCMENMHQRSAGMTCSKFECKV